jgi:hypothetical protein
VGAAEYPGVQVNVALDERADVPGTSDALVTVAPVESTSLTVPLGAMEPASDVTVAVYDTGAFAVTVFGAISDVDVGTEPTASADVVPAAVTDHVPGRLGVHVSDALPLPSVMTEPAWEVAPGALKVTVTFCPGLLGAEMFTTSWTPTTPLGALTMAGLAVAAATAAMTRNGIMVNLSASCWELH